MWNTPLYNTTKLTLELRDIVENGTDIWDFDYPSYYEGEKKKEFEQKVIDHFYFRQIGQETVGRWLHYFRTRIREIMPYYIQLYKTVEIMNNIEDPFGNVDIVETFEEETTGSASGSTSGQSSATSDTTSTGSSSDNKQSSEDRIHKFSNTPQGSISNLDTYMTEGSIDDNGSTENIESSSTGTSNSESASTSSSDSQSESSGYTKHTMTKKGNQGVNTYAHDMIEFRNSIIEVDMMIINQLQDLFLGVY